jgi:hypothetical protein
MANVHKWLLACKAAFVALRRMRLPGNDTIIASKGLQSVVCFKVPKDKITVVFTSANGPSVFVLTVRQTRKIISLINDACDANEMRTVEVDFGTKWTVDARLRDGHADQLRVTIHGNLEYLSHPVDREGLRAAANEISERIGLSPDSK